MRSEKIIVVSNYSVTTLRTDQGPVKVSYARAG